MALVSSTIVLPRDAAALRADLAAYLPHLPGRVADDGADFLQIRAGHRFALSPNRLRHDRRVAWRPQGEDLRVEIELKAAPYPWLEDRARRILEFRLAQFVTFLRERSAAAQSENGKMNQSPRARPDPEPFLQADWSSAATASAAALRLLLSATAAVVFAGLVMEPFGIAAVRETAVRLAARSLAMTAIGEPPLPSPAWLASLGWGDFAAAGLFFAVPFGAFAGLAVAFLLLLQENRPGPAAVVGWGIAALGAFLTMGLAEGASLLTALGCAFAAPLAAHAGYSLGCIRRPLVPYEHRPERSPWPLICLLGSAVLVGLGAAAFIPGGDGRDDTPLVEFRDRHLLNRGWGRAFADFYYRHTILPAEATRHPRDLLPATALVFTRRPELAAQIHREPPADGPPLPVVSALVATSLQDFEDMSARLAAGWDLFVIDLDVPGANHHRTLSRIRAVTPRGGVGVVLTGTGTDRFGCLGTVMNARPYREQLTGDWPDTANLALAAQDTSSRLRFLKGLSLSVVLGLGGPLSLLAIAVLLFAGTVRLIARLPPGRGSAFAVLAGIGALAVAADHLLLRRPDARLVQIRLPELEANVARNEPEEIAAALRDASAEVRFEAVYAAERGGDGLPAGRWVPALLPGLSDPEPRVRARAAAALGRIAAEAPPGEPARGLARQALLDLASDPHYMVRYRTAEALGRIGGPEARAALERMIRGGDAYVAQYAYRAWRSLR